ncbi:D-alanyl-D-alanine carboxypeptidase/D-alanyl-D-alanine-endopeptidase [Lipingzhangella sp. LS1_29]|uniref:D-alanyl-D-alanine carboxypeptidase/D-alanyl-D-alanine-endopeptidase n=1 Tax=Lipingzhangella rawalii TaxID=2055835 RepID=A0ABU2H4N3_9ACTN|nr:D-alanyl-D-alanine carboxypeptidase/D-alanyl-D-alanine-endopeptidase [Lipingzhangella rawalii]MDS1270262.1 D-alanyl-D-alanine carboxypeptidase/D-alanyl-D-alanine-endopeptidase [Lipingzhangella rawalii]
MRHDQPWVLFTLALLNLFVLLAALTAYDVIATRPPDPVASPVTHAAAAPDAMESDVAEVDATRLAEQLDDRMSGSAVEEGLSGYVAAPDAVDEPLFELHAEQGATPASTTKIATALAVLATVGPDERITTTVVGDSLVAAEGDSEGGNVPEVVLVGAGDPTLTEVPDPHAYPTVASLWELAAETAAELAEADVDTVRVGYDSSAYTGSDRGPRWRPNYVDGGSVAPVHALMHDAGRVDADDFYGERVGDPPRATATAFANQLAAAGIAVEGEPQERDATPEAVELAAVDSPPIGALVEYMLDTSDNNVAEALARQVALAEGEDASFAGAARASERVLDELGISGVELADGSGLSVDSEISPRSLVDMLAVATDPNHPDLHPTFTGLPVAGFTGTLSGRYAADSDAAAGAGLVRGKTGTLSGVSTLAGTVHDEQGRLLLFAFMANDPAATGSALDELAAAVVECGC